MTKLNEYGITAEMVEECLEYIQSISGVAFTAEQLATLIEDDEELVYEVVEWGMGDTEASGHMASAVAEHLLSRRWPIYGDNVDMDDFLANLRAAAIAKGYNVTDLD